MVKKKSVLDKRSKLRRKKCLEEQKMLVMVVVAFEGLAGRPEECPAGQSGEGLVPSEVHSTWLL